MTITPSISCIIWPKIGFEFSPPTGRFVFVPSPRGDNCHFSQRRDVKQYASFFRVARKAAENEVSTGIHRCVTVVPTKRASPAPSPIHAASLSKSTQAGDGLETQRTPPPIPSALRYRGQKSPVPEEIIAKASSTPIPWDFRRQAATRAERPMPIRQWTATALPAHNSSKINSTIRPASGIEKGMLLSGIGNEMKRRPQSPQSRSSSWSSSSAISSAVSSEATMLAEAVGHASHTPLHHFGYGP